MPDNNPFFISTEGTGITFGQIDDLVDFPHSGIIKALNQMSKGNYAIKTTNGFNITQSSSDPIITVAAGQYFRDGQKYSASQTTFNAAAFTATSDNSYYLIVVDSSNVVRLRVPTATNRVAQFTAGDTIIAMLEYSSSTSNGARRVQFFTTEKATNSLSLGYDSSGYTEMSKITAASGGTTVEVATAGGDFIIDNTDADKKIIMRLGSDDANTDFEIRNNSDAVKFAVDGAGTLNLGSVVNAGTDTDKFLVLDSGGNVDFRTGTEVASDIGAGTSITNTLVRYGLTSNKGLSSGSRYTFTSGDFTAYAADTNTVTFSGEDITLKGAGIFEVNLHGYFIANTASGQLQLDLSIGDGNQFNRYAYLRHVITLNDVVRMSLISTATIITTGDTVIELSGFINWGGSSPEFLATGSADPYSNNVPNNTTFTIRKVA